MALWFSCFLISFSPNVSGHCLAVGPNWSGRYLAFLFRCFSTRIWDERVRSSFRRNREINSTAFFKIYFLNWDETSWSLMWRKSLNRWVYSVLCSSVQMIAHLRLGTMKISLEIGLILNSGVKKCIKETKYSVFIPFISGLEHPFDFLNIQSKCSTGYGTIACTILTRYSTQASDWNVVPYVFPLVGGRGCRSC
jgi:hypothetical protein